MSGKKATISVQSSDKLRAGVYTLQEAALYARVSTQLLSRWFYGRGRLDRALEPSFPEKERILSFADFVQALAIRNARLQFRVPLQKIRAGIKRAEDDYGVSHPLARRHTIYLFGNDLYIYLETQKEFEKITGKDRNQKTMTKIVEVYMNDLGFDRTGLASYYIAHRYGVAGEERTIEMNPRFRFGEPVLKSCHYSARTLWEACQAEGGIAEAAHAYGVDEADVYAAFRYYDSLLIVRAA